MPKLLASFFLYAALSQPAAATENLSREVMVVTATRTAQAELETVGNIAQLTEAEIAATAAIHPYELGVRVPGVWIGQGSGQEHLTAIRSPVLTGPGSCGAFLIMEDGIPIRPAGFCNVNQMFEVPSEMAQNIEVIRGPANALYGSNGLHGTVNTLLPAAGEYRSTRTSLMGGSNDYWRGRFNWDSGPAQNAFAAGLMLDRDDGFRDDSGYKQAKLFGKSQHELTGGQLSFAITGTWLDQETAGFITGEDAYKDRDTRFRNENPEAYRNARSLRLSSTWIPESNGGWDPEYRFYLRNSEMDFLQHFLPTQPTEENGQTSGGIMFIDRLETAGGTLFSLGIDVDVARGFLKEDQAPGNERGFLPERPDGLHYDYEADSIQTAAFASVSVPLGQRWKLQAGLRGEYQRYDYDNRMIDGNSTDSGAPCPDPDNDFPPDGCLYNRLADRSDDFFNLSPNIGLLYQFNEATVGFVNYASGFRAPQAAELYRLQAQQDVSDIDSERLDSIEIGTRHAAGNLSLEAVAFYMYKSNFIFRDSAGLNVSDGKTKHYGAEVNLTWSIIEPVYLSFVGSYARQSYDFDREAGLGEIIQKGNEIDTAPQVLASARLGYENRFGLAELEWVHQDPYFLDAANTARYEGHDLLNLRLIFDATTNLQLAFRVNNLTDVAYADRADLLSAVNPSSYRYFPGKPRQYYLEAVWRTGSP